MTTPRLADLMEILEEIAPVELAESWDNPGLQVGSLDHNIQRVVLSLDPTVQAVEYAGSLHAQLLLTHHPLIFKPISSIRDGDYPGGVVYEAIRQGLSIVALHTNLDAAHEGINAILAKLLGLEEVEPLCQAGVAQGPKGSPFAHDELGAEEDRKKSPAKTGLGRIGDLASPLALSEFVITAKRILGLDSVKVVGEDSRIVKRVAVVGGSGGSLIKEAWARGADLLVTGDVSYHQAREAEFLGLAVIDGGHYATEKVAFREFSRELQRQVTARGWDVDIIFNEDETDPLVSR